MARILVISPSPGVTDAFIEANRQLNLQMQIEEADITRLPLVIRENKTNIDVVIGYGETADYIRQNTEIPIIEAHVSGYDILRTFLLLTGYQGKVGMLSTPDVIEGAKEIGALLDTNFPVHLYTYTEDITTEDAIRKAVAEGVEVLISDKVAPEAGARLGLNTIRLIPGKEAAIEALQRADNLGAFLQAEREKRYLFETAAQECQEGVLCVSINNNVLFLNKKASSYLDVRSTHVLGHPVSHLHETFAVKNTQETRANDVTYTALIQQTVYVIQKRTVEQNGQIIGHLFFLEPMSKTTGEGYESSGKSIEIIQQPPMHFTRLVATSDRMKKQLESARLSSRHDAPVFICGEPGTGKQSIAQAIHNESERRSFPFVAINGEACPKEQWESLLFGTEENPGALDIARGGTLFIQKINNMPINIQDKLITVLQTQVLQRAEGEAGTFNIRLIAASNCELSEEVKSGAFREELFRFLSGSVISLPPLRERREDIPELLRWFVAGFNVSSGKQIVGFRPDAISRLKRAPWVGNVAQLKQTVEDLCHAATGPFIDIGEVERIEDEFSVSTPAPTAPMKKQEAVPVQSSTTIGIDISGKTMEQIEKEVILRTLEEEGNNQSNAAKRLGISRGTLWRKIKDIP